MSTSRIDLILSAARARIDRLSAEAAAAELASDTRDAVLVDIRPAAQRAAHGEVPGALVIERNVLEWRFDATSDSALPVAHDDLRVIVLCQEGYTSSLAAAALRDVGVHRATDVVGGFAAWQGAGLATRPAGERAA
ncbi:rhodanese-like domain-containing protein [Oryzobacter sp. R7]|uniref:rhodanese-like domain-containing protein n=1 Tax=Oryzobacter faecalis TaxID=3388656 RepID=UPI00398D4D3F